MKKSLFGYAVSEVNVIIDTLREENENLNATITTLKTQIKNNVGEKSAKTILLEEDLMKYELDLIKLNTEKNELIIHINSLTESIELLKLENMDLKAQSEYLYNENKTLKQQLSKVQALEANSLLTREVAIANTDMPENNEDVLVMEAMNNQIQQFQQMIKELYKETDTFFANISNIERKINSTSTSGIHPAAED